MRLPLALAILASFLVVQLGVSAPAQAVSAGQFEIDGNLSDDPAGGDKDWSAIGFHATDPVGSLDTTNFQGTSKEFDPPSTWTTATGVAPGQDDISDVYSYAQSIGTDVWTYFGFKRATSTGTTNFNIEYNQLPTTGTNPPVPNRSVGDLLVQAVQKGSDPFAISRVLIYTLESAKTPQQWKDCIEVGTIDAGWCPLPIPAGAFTGATGEDGTFAEGALRISDFFGTGDCRGGFGTLNIRSYTGGDSQSALKDYVEPVSVKVDGTCGVIAITKVDQFGTPVGGATFEIRPNPMPGTTGNLVIKDGADPDGAGPILGDGTADGTITISPAKPGTYDIEETVAPAGFLLPADPIADGVEVVKNATTPVPFVDPRVFAPLQISNDATATHDVAYDWQVHKSVNRHRAQVADGDSASFGYTVTLEALPAGTPTGREVHGTMTVTNPNSTTMLATISSSLTGGISCAITGTDEGAAGAAGHQVTVESGANTYDYTCTPGAGATGTSTATVSWSSATYPANDPAETYTRSAGDDYTFGIDQTTDERAGVTDAFDGGAAEAIGNASYLWSDVWAAENHTVPVATYSRSRAGVAGTCTDYDNTATATENDTQQTSTDGETVTVCVGVDLDIDKVATLTYKRTYEWDVRKSGPGTVFTGEDGSQAVTYTVDVEATGYTDSERTLGGTIYIDNPNDWQDLTGTLTDEVTLDGATYSCGVTGVDASPATEGFQVTVPAGANNAPFAYTCPEVPQGAYQGTNTATITWGQAEFHTPSGTDSKTIAVSVSEVGSSVDGTVTLTDELDGIPVDLPESSPSSFTWASVHAMTGDSATGLPPHTQRLTYTRDLDTTVGECTSHDNVVALSDAAKSTDTHTVTVCAPSVTKTVNAEYGSKQLWTVTKDVDKTRIEVAEGGAATFHYTVKAVPGDVVDDGTASWIGTVSVTNPSDDTDLRVDVSDAPQADGWTCTFDSTADATADATADGILIPHGGEPVDLPYTCTGTGHPDGTNTATVSFDDEHVSTTEDVVFTARSTVADSVVALTDDIEGDGVPALEWTADIADDTTWTQEYDRTLDGVAGTCTTYTNRAELDLTGTADDPSDTKTVEVCVGKDLVIDKTATLAYDRTYEWDVRKSGPGTVFTGEDGTQEVTYTVDVVATGYTDSGWTLGGRVLIDNPNDWQAITGTLTDATTLDGHALTCTFSGDDAVPGTGTFEVTVPADADDHAVDYTCTGVSQGDYSGTNTATITWDLAKYATPKGHASRTVDVAVTADGSPLDGSVTLTDELDGLGVTLPQSSFDWATVHAMTGDVVSGLPAHTQRLTYTSDLGATVGTCTPHTNVVTLSDVAESSDEHTVQVCAPSVMKVVDADFGTKQLWTVTKDVDKTRVEVAEGGAATFHYTVNAVPGDVVDDGTSSWSGMVSVANPSLDKALTVDVTDTPDVGDWVCEFESVHDHVVVRPGQTVPLDYTCTGTGHPDGTNTATVSFDDEHVSTTVPVTFAARRDVTDSVVSVSDDIAGDADGPVTFTADISRPASWTHEYDRTFTGTPRTCTPYTNTAVLDLSDTIEDPSASQTVEVCEEAPLLIEVVPQADKVRKFSWSIDKQVDQTRRTIDPVTGTATFHYAVKVTAGPSTDSGSQLSGQVTVTNPNTYVGGDITADVEVAAADLGDGVTCDVAGGDNVVIPAHVGEHSGVVTLHYECHFVSTPADTGTVHAQATWTPPGAQTTTEVRNEAVVRFEVAELDRVVDVLDDKTRPGQRVVLEQGLTWAPGLTKTYEYDVALPGTTGQCVDFTNTAQVDITGPDDPTDSTAVTVCAPREPAAAVTASCAGYDALLDNTLSAVAVTFVVNAGGTSREVIVPAGQTQQVTGTLPPGTQNVTVSSAGQQLAGATRSESCFEVLPAQASGQTTGSVRASCQGTVRAHMKNTTEATATFVLVVGKKRHTLGVRAHDARNFQTSGKARARVTLKAGGRVLDRVRIPQRCTPPGVLPDTGLRSRSVARENSLGLRS